ncbi:hypothetical protein Q3G72_033182 [Acer saccharum]|nr:hypothetical protein Q3G72_033182 [Acer saccharum]
MWPNQKELEVARILDSLRKGTEKAADDGAAGTSQAELEVAMILNSLRKGTEKAADDGAAGTSQADNRARSLPPQLRILIESLKATHMILVMEKKLSDSDLNRKQSRLLFAREIKNKFLTEEEINKLDQDGGIEATVIQPCPGKAQNVQLKKRTRNGSQCFDYVLTGNWSQIVENSCLQTNDTVRLWSFRKESELYFALVKA